MEEKDYSVTEDMTPYISEDEEPPRRSLDIKIKKRDDVKESGNTRERLIAVMSVVILLFTVILALSIVLINSMQMKDPDEQNGTLPPSGNGVTDKGGLDGGENVDDYRDKPVIASNANAAESATEYRPSGDAAHTISEISSKGALLFDATSGTVVAGKSIDERMPIASMTKIMTLIVACDLISAEDMYKAVDIKYDAAILETYATCYISAKYTEETVYIVDLLYGLILESGADCAYGLAIGLAGSEATFVQKMNEKAAALGMSGTKFTNCVGKDDGGENYSTMRDVVTMLNYALKNTLCYNILTAEKWIPVGDYDYIRNAYADGSYEVRSLVHTRIKNHSVGALSFLGGKSGNESLAKYCLVSFGSHDGKTYICATAGHESSSYADTSNIYKTYIK